MLVLPLEEEPESLLELLELFDLLGLSLLFSSPTGNEESSSFWSITVCNSSRNLNIWGTELITSKNNNRQLFILDSYLYYSPWALP